MSEFQAVPNVTPEQRAKKGKKSMARRSGQCGYLERKGNGWYVRFWIDVPGQEHRKRESVRVCSVKGPDALTKPERERRAMEIVTKSGANSKELFERVEAVNLGSTFRQQAAWWMDHSQKRKRKPIKPATAVGYQSYIDNWLNPNLETCRFGKLITRPQKPLFRNWRRRIWLPKPSLKSLPW
jgi:hypothetical protein